MSARTPFVPNNSHPIARANHAPAQPPGSESTTPLFTPEFVNPLHSSGPTIKGLPAEQVPQRMKEDTSISVKDNANKPLNTASILKTMKLKPASRKSSFESSQIQRPQTTDPNSKSQLSQNDAHTQSVSIIAPVPRPAVTRPLSPSISAASFTSIFAPNDPQIGSRQLFFPVSSDSNDRHHNDAHISGSSLDFSFSKASVPSAPDMPKSPMTGRSFPCRYSLDPSMNSSKDGVPHTSTPHHSQSRQIGTQRILASDGSLDSSIVPNNESNDKQRLSRTGSLKRPRPDGNDSADLANHMNDHGVPKRYKGRGDGYIQHSQAVTISHPSSPLTLSNDSISPGPMTSMNDFRSYQYPQHSHPQAPMTPPLNHYPQTNGHGHNSHPIPNVYPQGDAPQAHLKSLDRLLGFDVDEFVDQYADRFEKAVERWKNCTLEEWAAGAEEHAARYAKIFDFAKNHMISKMKLFADFDANIDQQKQTLAEREKMLENLKSQLVKESENVLGGGLCH